MQIPEMLIDGKAGMGGYAVEADPAGVGGIVELAAVTVR
jgi:hypothetical protein